MQLLIDGVLCDFIPIKQFREQQQLPESFGIPLFEPKDFRGLAAIDNAGSEMNDLRQALLDFVPPSIPLTELLDFVGQLRETFRTGLYGINDVIGLKVEEVEFAVSGFGDVNQALCYALIRSRATKSAPPPFMSIYYEWLNNSVRLSQQIHTYQHHDEDWQIQIVNHVYGRAGLRVATPTTIHYVQHSVYGCPAEGYMQMLITDLATLITERLS